MIIATINIWGHSPSWPARREILVDALEDIDIICLQEVYTTDNSDQAGELAHKLNMPHRAIDFRGGEGVAILSKVALSDISWHDLDDGGGFPRLAVVASARDEQDRLVTIISSHVSFSPMSVRVRQIDQLLDMLDHFDRAILAGDLNTEPDKIRLTSTMSLAPIDEVTWPHASREEILRSLPEKKALFDLRPAQIDHLIGKNIDWTSGEVLVAKQQGVSGSDHGIVIGEF